MAKTSIIRRWAVTRRPYSQDGIDLAGQTADGPVSGLRIIDWQQTWSGLVIDTDRGSYRTLGRPTGRGSLKTLQRWKYQKDMEAARRASARNTGRDPVRMRAGGTNTPPKGPSGPPR